MKLKQILAMVLGIVVSLPAVVAAHEGHDHMKGHKMMGTVASVDAEKGRLDIKTKDGKSMTISLDAKTKYYKGDKPAALGDVTVGARVVVTAMDDAGAMKAMEVHLSETQRETAPATAAFTCPMHPEVLSDMPGKCPKCGMNLEPKK